jgi:hypothetical protein
MEGFDPTQPSKGLGDTIAKVTHYTGISKLTDVITDALGIEDCGCNRRREALNADYSYNIESNSPKTYNPKDFPPAEEGIYEVLKQINANSGGTNFEFKPGDKILLTKEHSLYSDWPFYIEIEAVKKTN